MSTPRLLARVILVPTGVAIGSAVAAAVLLGGLIARHGLGALGEALAGFVVAVVGFGMEDGDAGRIADGIATMWLVLCLLLAGPMALAALVGEAAGLSRPVGWTVLTGLFYAALPVLFTTGGEALAGFSAAGLCAGLSYWAIAGRGAARTPPTA